MENESKLKLAQVLAKHFCPNGKSHLKLYGASANCYSRENFAECSGVADAVDELIDIGFDFKSEFEKKARLLLIACNSFEDKAKRIQHNVDVLTLAWSFFKAQAVKLLFCNDADAENKVSSLWEVALKSAKESLQISAGAEVPNED